MTTTVIVAIVLGINTSQSSLWLAVWFRPA